MSATTEGTRALTGRQARLGVLDKANEQHWLEGHCWCKAPHGGEAGLTFVAPPWDQSRKQERAW